MAFNQDIPQASDDPSQSQSQFLANFQALSTYLNVNHVELNDGDEGKHTFVQMPEQSSGPSTAANEGAIYTKESSLTSATELFFRRESNGSELPISAYLGSSNGWAYLPSGLLLKWGTGNGTGSFSKSYPTSAAIPVFTAVYFAQVNIVDSSSTPDTFVTLKSYNTTAISVFGSKRTGTTAGAINFNYMVIGI